MRTECGLSADYVRKGVNHMLTKYSTTCGRYINILWMKAFTAIPSVDYAQLMHSLHFINSNLMYRPHVEHTWGSHGPCADHCRPCSDHVRNLYRVSTDQVRTKCGLSADYVRKGVNHMLTKYSTTCGRYINILCMKAFTAIPSVDYAQLMHSLHFINSNLMYRPHVEHT